MKKLTTEELTGLQAAISTKLDLETDIGRLVVQQNVLTAEVHKATKTLVEIQKKLEEIYGDITVNITNGEITENATDS